MNSGPSWLNNPEISIQKGVLFFRTPFSVNGISACLTETSAAL